ncbi:hypothetical protein Ahy_A02g006819 [Arachis hypogaea]|uniref:Transposase-associated domain-containing protein n=1 Tax=Arachis hypogaea TaxID=3818 RepID=A0A445EB97_ARAHY|nr:hypothetical protein Ahy_A02g006819 [Arachis hypogaea]
MIHCPCPSCGFWIFQTRDDAYDHLLMKPFPTNYTFWLHDGERRVGESSSERHEGEPYSVCRDPMRDMVHEAFNFQGFIADEEDSSNEHFGGAIEELPYLYNEPSYAARDFNELLEDEEAGLNIFLDIAFANASSDGMIHCPCPSCGFWIFQTRDDAYDHLLMKPFPTNYTFWLHDGERRVGESSSERHEGEPYSVCRDPMRDMVHEAFNFQGFIADEEDSSNEHFGGAIEELPYLYNEPSYAARDFNELLEDEE